MYTIICTFFLFYTTLASQIAPDALASNYALPSTTSLPFPTATLSSNDSETLLVSKWSLNKNRVQDGPQNLAFVNDPFPDKPPSGAQGVASPSGPVLRVTYPEGSFSHDTGGAQFYSVWNTTDGSKFTTMMVSYELAFDSNFDWVKGGKLPGLRGGLSSTGCSGGNQADGSSCFSTRLMWRKDAAGEVYAYIPTTNDLCIQKSITCNTDYGVSIQRGIFKFSSGQWTRLTLLVQLNSPPTKSNGVVQLFINDQLTVTQSNLQIRTAESVVANGFYFSTFFGGSDSSWATPVTTHTYFRNIRLWGSSAANVTTSNSTLSSDGSPRMSLASSVKLALLFIVSLTLYI